MPTFWKWTESYSHFEQVNLVILIIVITMLGA
jgi:hypothetical protein